MNEFMNFWLPMLALGVWSVAAVMVWTKVLRDPLPKKFRTGQVVEGKYHDGLWVVVEAGPLVPRQKSEFSGYEYQEILITPVVRVGGGYAFPQERPVTPMLHVEDRNPYDLHDCFPAVGKMKVGVWPDWVTFNRP